VEDNAGQLVPAFPSVELGQNAAAIGFVVDIAQHVERFDDPAKFLQRPREGRRSVMGLEGSHQTSGLDQTQLQRTGQAQKIIPILSYEAHPHFVGGEIVEWAKVFCSAATQAPL
jgi:hypothetical protein